ncbi:hypothetical protein SS05631_c14420 [Sinorhizobium sp. CCBAU 05631]|nr:hypothetical protein SS05631_c14420 [Sinorhizobium sp. CCBAU 05631]
MHASFAPVNRKIAPDQESGPFPVTALPKTRCGKMIAER